MTREENLKKGKYKLMLVILKVIPVICAAGCLLNTLLAYVGIDIPILSYLNGMSLWPWLFILLASFVFRFCIYHRIFLYYIATIDVIDIIDYHFQIPISDYNFLVLHIILAGFALLLILYFYVKISKKAVKQNN